MSSVSRTLGYLRKIGLKVRYPKALREQADTDHSDYRNTGTSLTFVPVPPRNHLRFINHSASRQTVHRYGRTSRNLDMLGGQRLTTDHRRHQGRCAGRHRQVWQQVLREQGRAAAYVITDPPIYDKTSRLTLETPVRTRWVDYAKHDYDAYVPCPSPGSHTLGKAIFFLLANRKLTASIYTVATSNRSGTPGFPTPSTRPRTKIPSPRLLLSGRGRPRTTSPTRPLPAPPTSRTTRALHNIN